MAERSLFIAEGKGGSTGAPSVIGNECGHTPRASETGDGEPGGGGHRRGGREPEQDLVLPVVVEPVHQAAPMLMSASSCRDGNEPHLEPGDGHLEARTVEDLDHLVEVIQPGQRKVA